jgi:hypothetical protein
LRRQGQRFNQVYAARASPGQFNDQGLKLLPVQGVYHFSHGGALGYAVTVMYEAKQSGHDVLAIPAPIVGAGTDGVGRLVAFQGNANAVRGVLTALDRGKDLVAGNVTHSTVSPAKYS